MSFPSDNDPNTYQGTILKLIAASTTSFSLDPHVTELFGSPTISCTVDVKDTLETIEMPQNSQLRVIQNYAFNNCSKLTTLDLTQCIELKDIGSYAFYRCSLLSTISFPKSKLGNIGELCFNYDHALTEIVIPNTVKTIGKWCFMYCTKLEKFSFEKGSVITTLDKWLIASTPVKEFTVPASVTTIYAGALENIYSLESFKVEPGNLHFKECGKGLITYDGTEYVAFPISITGEYTIPEGITQLKSISFSKTKLSNVTFPNTLQEIKDYAFLGAPNLKEIIIPDSVTTIGSYVFRDCKSAATLKLPCNITVINEYTFYGCAFTTVEIPHGVTKVLGNCFSGNNKLTKIILPSTITTLGGNVFPDNPNLDIIFSEGTNMKLDKDLMIITDLSDTIINQYMGTHENFKYNVPKTFTTIKSEAFYKKDNLVEIIFPEDSLLTHIEKKAFAECQNLVKFVFPNSLQYIGDSAFMLCTSLTKVEFGTNLQSFSNLCFSKCSKLELVNMCNSKVSEIKESDFQDCTSLGTVNLPPTITTFSQKCFNGCTSLSNLVIPPEAKIAKIGNSAFKGTQITSFSFNDESTIKVIESYAFAACKKLSSIKFCPSITKIDAFAFESSGLESVALTDAISVLGPRCFINCESLVSIKIPKDSMLSEENFGQGAFANCYNLSEIKCDSAKFSVSVGALFSSDLTRLILFPPGSKIAYFPIPEMVTKIGNSAFQGCNNLCSVIISGNATKAIGISAFEGCKNLHYINIPSGINSIGADAFKGCSSLVCGVDVQDSNDIPTLINIAMLPPKSIRRCDEITVNRCRHYAIPFYAVFSTLMLVL